MSRYIDAESLKSELQDWGDDAREQNSFLDENDFVNIIDSEPTADVATVVHAHWTKKSHEWDFPPYFYHDFTCSNCGVREQDKAPYCRYCGAKMDGKENEK